MAESGNEVAAVVAVRAQPVEVAQILVQSLQSGGNYLEDTQVVPVGPTTIRVTRRFMAQWAIVLGIIGLFLCFIGIVAFFFRDTEELTIDIQPDGTGGSRVTLAGKAKGTIVTTVLSTLARFDGYSEAALGLGSNLRLPPPLSDDGNWWWDGSQWLPVPPSSRTIADSGQADTR